jgi:steroid 5-alpha reductase family enzyme
MSDETFVQVVWAVGFPLAFLALLLLGAGIREAVLRFSETDWAARRRPAALRRWAEILKGE